MLESTRSFARQQLPIHLKQTSTPKQTRELYTHFGTMGLLGPTLPSPYGSELSYKMYGLMASEIEWVDSAFRSMYSVQSSLVMNPIYAYGSTKLQRKYLSRLGLGEYVGCFGLTEPDAGSDTGQIKTEAIRDGDEYVLSGNKTWITNAPIADVFVIWAKINDTVGGFVLDRGMEGIQTPEINDKMSLMNSPTGMIHLTEVRVPKENRLQVEGMKGPFSCLNNARLGISFGVMGAASNCLETTLEYAQDRVLFGSSLASKQLFQHKLASMVTDYNLGLEGAFRVADLVDNGQAHPVMISMMKRNNCEKALGIARTCRDILGGNGISEGYNIFRHLINLETVNTYEGTFDIHSLILGQYFTGKAAY